MGLFRELGRRTERFAQQVATATAAEGECADCGEAVAPDLDRCPECGGETRVPED